MATKRTLDQDPDYDAIPVEIQEKRIKLLEDNVRKQTTKKIETIIRAVFGDGIAKKEAEIESVDEALHEGRCMMDRLRACGVTKYYATVGQEQALNEHAGSSIHPTVKKYLGKSPKKVNYNSVDNPDSNLTATQESEAETSGHRDFDFSNIVESNEISEKIWSSNPPPETTTVVDDISTRAPRFKRKCKIIVGNVSRFIPVWQRDRSDQSTHKWMVYVRGDKYNPSINNFVKKVRFLLHPSYRPSDIVEITNPPFELVKRGWGEFPVRVQLHFHDPRNKPVDIIHNLKLDKTFTGLQTLGSETVVELQLFKEEDFRINSCNSSFAVSAPESSSASKNGNNMSVNCNGPISEESNSSEKELNSNVHTIVQKEPNSLILNIKLSKNVTNDAKSHQSSAVNTHKIISSPPSSLESNAEKKTVPKIVISNNKVTTVPSVTKPATIANGLNIAFVKCKDNEGRVLIVPQSSLTFKAPPNAAKLNNIPQSNANTENSNSSADNNINKTVPSYKLKFVSNQDSGQNQVFLIPMSAKKEKSPSIKSPKEIKTETVDPDDLTSNMQVSSYVELSSKTERPTVHYEQELDNIKLENYKSFVELLKRVAKVFPLVKKGVDRSVFTFCADSLEEYQKWNIGKQRACEWRRAGMVRKSILNLLTKKASSCIHPESVWSQSTVMSWLRKNGFVPMATEKVTLLPEPKWSGVELCSLTNADDIVSSLREEKDNLVSSDDEEIEIIDICDEKKPEKNSTTSSEEVCHLPQLSDAASFVKMTAAQIDVDIKPVELKPNVYMPVIEEMILSACQGLASDLIGCALNEGFSRLGGRICPEDVTVSDVYSAIRNSPQFDFIPNSFLGIPKDSDGNT